MLSWSESPLPPVPWVVGCAAGVSPPPAVPGWSDSLGGFIVTIIGMWKVSAGVARDLSIEGLFPMSGTRELDLRGSGQAQGHPQLAR